MTGAAPLRHDVDLWTASPGRTRRDAPEGESDGGGSSDVPSEPSYERRGRSVGKREGDASMQGDGTRKSRRADSVPRERTTTPDDGVVDRLEESTWPPWAFQGAHMNVLFMIGTSGAGSPSGEALAQVPIQSPQLQEEVQGGNGAAGPPEVGSQGVTAPTPGAAGWEQG